MIYIKNLNNNLISVQDKKFKYYYLKWKKDEGYYKDLWDIELHKTEEGHQILGPTALVEWE